MPFEPETHVRYISVDTLRGLHDDTESFLQGTLSDKADMVYQYEAVINIRRIYDKLERS